MIQSTHQEFIMRFFFIIFIIVFFLGFSGCSIKHPLLPQAETVRLYDALPQGVQCTYIDEIVGSEANMLTFLFLSNRDITIGARNDLRNQALKMGGNTVVIQKADFVYTTSTVFIGQVYNCKK